MTGEGTATPMILWYLPSWVHIVWYVSGNGSANTTPRNLSIGGALFCNPPNLPEIQKTNENW